MADFSSIQAKINSLKAEITHDAITPLRLGSILDDLLSGLNDTNSTAVSTAGAAMSAAQAAKNAISSEASARTAADTSEAAARSEADQELSGRITAEESRAKTTEQLLNDRIAQLKNDLDALDHENATEAIESFREILAFLEGISDDETLLAKLTEIKSLINSVAANISRTDQQLSAAITSETNRATAAETALEERIDEHDGILESFDEDIRALYDGARSHQRQFMQVEGKFATEQELFTALSRAAVTSRPWTGAIVEANIGGVWQLWQYRYNMLDFEQLLDTQSDQLPDAQAQEQSEGDAEARALPPAAPDQNIASPSNWVRIATIDDTTKVFDDMWRQAAGGYGAVDHTHKDADGRITPYMVNNVWSTYEEAVAIYINTNYNGGKCEWLYAGLNLRTNIPLPVSAQSSYLVGFRGFCYGARFEVLNVGRLKLDTTANVLTGSYKRIIGEIFLGSIKPTIDLRYGKFEDVALLAVGANLLLDNSQSLLLTSVQYLVANATNTSPITIKVHPDVYAKLTGDTTNEAAATLSADELAQWQQVLTSAAAKKISFAC